MARRTAEDHQYVWRAVVTRTYPSGRNNTTYCGPFINKGNANNSANAESKWGDAPITITVQRSQLSWEDVETRKVTHD